MQLDVHSTRARRARPAADTGALWAAYRASGDDAERDALVDAYAGFARILAAKAYARRIVDELEFGDYLQYATVGLIEAVERYDPARGAKFESFAGLRINGAILNGLAQASDLQEQLALRRRLVAERTELLAAEEDAAGDVFARLAGIAVGLAVGFMLDGSGMFHRDSGGIGDNTYSGVELRQLRAQVRAAVAGLPQRQRQVIQAHYLQGRPFAEVAGLLGVTPGRVSQLHKEAMAALRERLRRSAEVALDF